MADAIERKGGVVVLMKRVSAYAFIAVCESARNWQDSPVCAA